LRKTPKTYGAWLTPCPLHICGMNQLKNTNDLKLRRTEEMKRGWETKLHLWYIPMRGGGENVTQVFPIFAGSCILLRIWWKIKIFSTGKNAPTCIKCKILHWFSRISLYWHPRIRNSKVSQRSRWDIPEVGMTENGNLFQKKRKFFLYHILHKSTLIYLQSIRENIFI
jgi:hypothetical protein